ncbi:PTS lactose/cellobiose transporter subunit IIA [Caproiciproducens sp. CPB-2]|uniref:PTS lactose/cellobiose transporter subunit IIA n=1 Tax=Caproiciproducens sp. CPB-2 TaxID=3030017 RepID=UPI0023DA5983|nr:PTS lactose/cellobiose transporter subunit IIA [Caproiciproducens sp. CPB-2]MDF1493168.1 PTS lactose/cellobiose transporter subunit IIA [Caproiciproducens sp. CPB-2]
MEKNEENIPDELAEISMKIIMSAGDARLYVTESLKAVEQFDFTLAEEKLTQSKKKIAEAHNAQTEILQKEISGDKIGYSVLFSHAQDTLMTVNSEYILAKELVKVFASFYKKFDA